MKERECLNNFSVRFQKQNKNVICNFKAKTMKSLFSLTILLLSNIILLNAQQTDEPIIFLMGQDEKLYEELKGKYAFSLLDACNDDMQLAFKNWIEMAKEMENYAKEENVNINGIRAWIHVFFSEEGKINYLGFLLKPDSRNMDLQELKAFFKGFAKSYTFPIKYKKNYYHYTGVTFPTFSDPSQRR